MKKVNLNDKIRVKLTPKGAEIFYHRYDDLHKRLMRNENVTSPLNPKMPQIGKDGFTSFQLWDLINLYGQHINIASENVFSAISLYFDDDVVEDVKAE